MSDTDNKDPYLTDEQIADIDRALDLPGPAVDMRDVFEMIVSKEPPTVVRRLLDREPRMINTRGARVPVERFQDFAAAEYLNGEGGPPHPAEGWPVAYTPAAIPLDILHFLPEHPVGVVQPPPPDIAVGDLTHDDPREVRPVEYQTIPRGLQYEVDNKPGGFGTSPTETAVVDHAAERCPAARAEYVAQNIGRIEDELLRINVGYLVDYVKRQAKQYDDQIIGLVRALTEGDEDGRCL